ncbi:uncharacterized protein BO95DRAFT_38738, partial [Aspergillus brunneoviolaceus CBS 621.78]
PSLTFLLLSCELRSALPDSLSLSAWETLDPGQKSSIAGQLHSYLVQLRRLKGTYIGAAGHGKACIGQRAPIEGGPFDSEQQFNTFILEDLVKLPEVLQHYAKHALTDNHEIVFTRGDFAPPQYPGGRGPGHGCSGLGRCWLVSRILGVYQGHAASKADA